MWLELIFNLAVGAIFCILGLRVLKSRSIGLIHDYHYKNVSDENKKPYTKQIGIGIIIIGGSIILSGLLGFLFDFAGKWLLSLAGFVTGMVLIIKAQNKFNGGMGLLK